MGAKKSIFKGKVHNNRPIVFEGVLLVAGDAWVTEPLIKTFRKQHNLIHYFSNTITIDGNSFDMYIMNRSMEDLSELHAVSWRNVGLMLVYDVTDGDSFETAKQIAICPHPEMVSIR